MGYSRCLGFCAAVAAGSACITSPASDGDSSKLFDPNVLHEIRIEVEPQYIEVLETDRTRRVPCTFMFDGVQLDNVGVRLKGGGSQSSTFAGKPSFSIKFNEFVKGQRLFSTEKLLLNSSGGDPTFLHEPLGYDLYGRAGFPYRRTAHAVVTFSGLPSGDEVYGIHVLVEAVNKEFLAGYFGEELDHGNLFEDEDVGDFAGHALEMDLKDPEDPGRSYDRLVEFATLLGDAPDDVFMARLPEFMDVDHALDSFALDLVSQHNDGFWHAAHNYYLYEHPETHRFSFIPHGMDLLFGPTGACGRIEPADDQTTALGERIIDNTALATRVPGAVSRVLDTAWNESLMEERIATLERLLESSHHDEWWFTTNLDAFKASRDELRHLVHNTRAVWSGAPAGSCGDGVRNGGELCAYACDDGNLASGDGCSAQCLVEYCGDRIVQPGIGEVCDDEPDCNYDCTAFEVCGNGTVEGYEECDDANSENDDACRNDCTLPY